MTRKEITFFNQMNIKKIIIYIILLININLLNSSEIIMNKDNVIITKKDVENYQTIYRDYFKIDINKNSSIKNLYISIKTLNYHNKINKNFKNITDNLINEDLKQFGKEYNQETLIIFLKYEILKKDFINNYYENYDFNNLNYLFENDLEIYNNKECQTRTSIINYDEITRENKILLLSNYRDGVINIKDNEFICLTKINIDEINFIVSKILETESQNGFLGYVFSRIK